MRFQLADRQTCRAVRDQQPRVARVRESEGACVRADAATRGPSWPTPRPTVPLRQVR